MFPSKSPRLLKRLFKCPYTPIQIFVIFTWIPVEQLLNTNDSKMYLHFKRRAYLALCLQPPTKHAGFQLPGKSDALLVHPHVGQKASWSKGGGANTHALCDVLIIELSVLDAGSFLKSSVV